MEVKPLKTVRFTKLIEESGHPVPATLWTAPEEDAEFSKAIREGRVLTVVPRNVGAKADYGLVGFFKESLATYLVFPNKLQNDAETKVIGIKYEQLAEAKPKGPMHKPSPERPPGVAMRKAVTTRAEAKESSKTNKSPTHHPRPEPHPPKSAVAPVPRKIHRFRSTVEITLREIIPVEVEAQNVKEAAQLVRAKMASLQPNLATATLKKRATAPKRL